ncbi:MAG: hypothetical protein AB1724_11345 [Thermodesulfobacteriota bacterium]
MNAKLMINNYEITLGHKGLEEIAFWLEDAPENSDIFHELAKSESSALLVNLVDKEHLARLTVRMLIEDSSLEVMRAVIDSRHARKHMTRRDMEAYLATGDCELLSTMARDLEYFTEVYEVCEKDWLCEKLAGQKDPGVRFALAENTDTPVQVLEDLTEDDDPDVARQAEKTLAEIREAEEDEDEEDDEDEDEDDDIPL